MPSSFAYPTPIAFGQEAPSTPSRQKGHVKGSASEFYKDDTPSSKPSSRRNLNQQHDQIPESPRRRGPSRGSLSIRSKSNDESFFGRLKKSSESEDGAHQNRPQPSPAGRSKTSRSKSNDENFFEAVEGAPQAPKPRPTLPKTKSGRCLPKPVVSRSRTTSGTLNKNPKSKQGDFVRKAPGKTQSAGNLDSMRQSIEEEPQKVPASPRGGKSRMTPASPSRPKSSWMPPASPSRKKLWLISPGKKGKDSVDNRSISKLKGLISSSDHGPAPPTPTKSKGSLSKTIHTDSPTSGAERNTKETDDKGKKTKTFQQLLAKKKPDRSKSSDLAGMTTPRERSMSPIRGNNNPTKSMGDLPTIQLDDDDDDDCSLSPEPKKPSSGLVAGLWSSFNGSFRKNDDDDDDESDDEDFGVTRNPSQDRGRTMDRKTTPPRDEDSLSPVAVKKPASTGGLITGFIDKMYDSFMKEDDGNDSDEDDYAMMHNSVSRLDRRINQLAGLQ